MQLIMKLLLAIVILIVNLLGVLAKQLLKIEVLVLLLAASMVGVAAFILLPDKPVPPVEQLSNLRIKAKPVNLFASSEKDNPFEKVILREIKSGDTLSDILNRSGFSPNDTMSVIKALAKIKSSELKKRDRIYIHYEDILDPLTNKSVKKLNQLKIIASGVTEYEIIRAARGGFNAKKLAIELFSKLQFRSGKVTRSLYQDAAAAGIPSAIMMEFIRLYSYDIDMQREVKSGDKFQVFYEAFYDKDGKFVKNGNLIFSKFIVKNKQFTHYKYTTSKGSSVYLDGDGKSISKSLLKTPINGARISSNFGYRMHPILGYSRLHTGVDFAAFTGTPILASGTGIIDYMGWKGGYGKYVSIRHNSKYSTAYAHMSRFASNVKVGSRVTQGQVIGYVGSTGRSTGPHLHYEVHANGKPVNPRSIKSESKVSLKSGELQKFKIYKARIDGIVNAAFAGQN